MAVFRAGRGGTTLLPHGSGFHRCGLGAEVPLTPTPETPMSPEPGTHILAAPTYAGCLCAWLRGAAVPVPQERSRMLQRSIAEDVKPSLGHGRDLLLLGCSQVLQEASSVRQGQMLAGSKPGTGMMGTTSKPRHVTLHSQPPETPCTSHTTAGTWRIQPSPSPAERQVTPPQLRDRDATAPEGLSHRCVAITYQTHGPGAHHNPHPKAAKPRRASRQRLVGTLLRLMPCWPEEAHAWRHTHASTYSNFLKIGLSPCKEGTSSRLRENRG